MYFGVNCPFNWKLQDDLQGWKEDETSKMYPYKKGKQNLLCKWSQLGTNYFHFRWSQAKIMGSIAILNINNIHLYK